jgi:type I restriction enzyme S subunit
MRGDLVSRDGNEGEGHSLLEPMAEVMRKMIQDGVIRKPRYEMGRDLNPVPYEIPSHWTWVELGDVGAIVGGGTPKSTEAKFWAEGEDIPWLTPADMSAFKDRLIQRGRRDITSEGLAGSSTSLVPSGTVLFSSRAPIGHVGIAANQLCTNQGFKSCVPYNSEMSEFIYYYLMKAGPEVNENATGTTFKEVSGKQVAAIPFPLPPLGEMIRIVGKLDELFALCDELQASLSHAADLQGQFAEAAKASLV